MSKKDLFATFSNIQGNIDLLNYAIELNSKLLEEYEIQNEGTFTDDYLNNKREYYLKISYDLLEIYVFPFCEYASLFNEYPLKLNLWYRKYLSQFDIYLRKIFTALTIKVLSDKDRFPFKNASYLISELKNIELENISEIYNIENAWEYISGFDHIKGDGAFEKVLGVYYRLRLYLKPEYEVHLDYIEKNFSPELLKAINKKLGTSYTEIEKNKRVKNNIDKTPIINDAEFIESIFETLQKLDCIDCTKHKFNRLFSGNNLRNFDKINWLKTNGSLKAFLKLKNMPPEYSKKYSYIAESCFLFQGKQIEQRYFSANVKSSKSDIELIKPLLRYSINSKF